MAWIQFQHEALVEPNREISLLEPSSPVTKGRLCFKLLAFPLRAAPSYAAVSYTWGAPGNEIAVEINGKDFFRPPKCHQSTIAKLAILESA